MTLGTPRRGRLGVESCPSPSLSEVALLSHSPCSPSEREPGMRRHDFIIFLAGAMAAWPLAARAQQKAVPVIGYLGSEASGPSAPFVTAFLQGLNDTGFVEGQNLVIEYRWADGRYDRLPALVTDFVGRKVAVIAALGLPSALAAKNATSTIPIVFSVGDPVGRGLVASLARPGGNLTGVSLINVELTMHEDLDEAIRRIDEA